MQIRQNHITMKLMQNHSKEINFQNTTVASGLTGVAEKYKTKLKNLQRKIRNYNPGYDSSLLKKAYIFSYAAHEDQLRKSGEPYFEHPLKVANILADLRMDLFTICGGLLHDVAEDTGVTLDEVREQFGDEIATLVDGVTKISEIKFDSLEVQQAENFRKMIISMIEDIRVILIKFADRLHNMRTIEFLPERKRKRIARETLEVYAPLAHRLGIARLKWELEDLSFKTINPAEYDTILKKVNNRREEREKYIQKITRPIRKDLKKFGFEAMITGRPKHFYSIYMKMKRQNLTFEEIYDLLAIRIILKKIEDCYFTLGIVHSIFTPIHEKFNDYIATPKSNMYQSLHTKVIGPEGKTVEIQIRTEEMHRTAEEGIAAHWRYKEGKAKEDELDKSLAWLRRVLDWQQDDPESKEFMEYLKIDLFQDEVFVFTPKGDLFRLPAGATAVDFAFAVHTDVGYHCLGAKVNSRIVPLSFQLRSGDTVEIITSEKQHPNPDWINFVKTSKARSKIKKWKRDSLFAQSQSLGEDILQKDLKKYKIRMDNKELREIAQTYGYSDISDLYAAIGRGEVSSHGVLRKLAPQKTVEEEEDNLLNRLFRKTKSAEKGVLVQDMDNMMIKFGNCCRPVPGDRIIGFITKGRGVVVHRTECNNMSHLAKYPDQLIEVKWDVGKDKVFNVPLYILAHGSKDFLLEVSETLSRANANISDLELKTEDRLIHTNVLIEVRNLDHLNHIKKRISKLKHVIRVERLNGHKPASDNKSKANAVGFLNKN